MRKAAVELAAAALARNSPVNRSPHEGCSSSGSASVRIVSILFLSACLSQGVHAESATSHRSLVSPHGGQTHVAGPYDLELVTGETRIVVYVTDHGGRPIDIAGGKGKAVVHTDGHGVTVVLSPAAGNMLEGVRRFRLKHSSIVYVTVDLAHDPPHHAVFRPFANVAARSSGRAHH